MGDLDRLEVDAQAIVTFSLLSELMRMREEPDGITTESLAGAVVRAIGDLEALVRQAPRA